MTKYVAGFMFSKDLKKVLLIKKNRPDWQRGKLNGIGGKVEPEDKDLHAALSREFVQETGLRFNDWKFFCTLHINDDVEVYFAAATSDIVDMAISPTDEWVALVRVDTVEQDRIAIGWIMENAQMERAIAPSLYNVPWLVRMAIDSLTNEVSYDVIEKR